MFAFCSPVSNISKLTLPIDKQVIKQISKFNNHVTVEKENKRKKAIPKTRNNEFYEDTFLEPKTSSSSSSNSPKVLLTPKSSTTATKINQQIKFILHEEPFIQHEKHHSKIRLNTWAPHCVTTRKITTKIIVLGNFPTNKLIRSKFQWKERT